MVAFLTKLLLIVRSRLHSQARLQAEILVLRQQVLILDRKSPSRVVRTISFELLYGLVILGHLRRKLIRVSVTTNPSAE